ncbi:MAG TPA: NAD-glutamate dehydrogenase [Burkholderiaceae bacterium]|nr:NAD-glutamate dehydrogenase [Burkholderiaceae bacterium]
MPEALARRVARLDAQFSALDIVEVAEQSGQRIEPVAAVYFGVGGRLDLGRLSAQIAALVADGRWATLARVALRDDLTLLARGLAQSVLSGAGATGEGGGCGGETEALIEAWEARREFQLARYRQVLADQRRAGSPDLAMLSVTLRELRALV